MGSTSTKETELPISPTYVLESDFETHLEEEDLTSLQGKTYEEIYKHIADQINIARYINQPRVKIESDFRFWSAKAQDDFGVTATQFEALKGSNPMQRYRHFMNVHEKTRELVEVIRKDAVVHFDQLLEEGIPMGAPEIPVDHLADPIFTGTVSQQMVASCAYFGRMGICQYLLSMYPDEVHVQKAISGALLGAIALDLYIEIIRPQIFWALQEAYRLEHSELIPLIYARWKTQLHCEILIGKGGAQWKSQLGHINLETVYFRDYPKVPYVKTLAKYLVRKKTPVRRVRE